MVAIARMTAGKPCASRDAQARGGDAGSLADARASIATEPAPPYITQQFFGRQAGGWYLMKEGGNTRAPCPEPQRRL
ncbi:hypothetical protein [Thauera chlorobenzoica]|uniref:hypothetical protein n=1 Tax=Thauera chlorobenzoica TaxID=96773 RepID=UPI0011B02FCA|nr:hypothetical protein [Thauera chlorobenzoica]